MMSNWKQDIFNNFIKLNRGFDLPEKNIVAGPYPVVASTSIKDMHNNYKVNPPAVVTGRSGSLGTVQYINSKCWPLNTTLYVKDFKGNNPKFVFYLLKTLRLENFNSGAGVPSLNQNHLHKLKLNIPPLLIQKKIASILSAYDDLIENNNNKNAVLERMTEELYKEWFVRLRFPNYKNTRIVKGVPVGWSITELREVATEVSKSTKPGKHLENRFYLPIELLGIHSFLPIGHFHYTEAQSSLVLFEQGDIVFGAMRPYLHKVSLAPFNGITRTTCFVIRPRSPEYYSWLFLLLFQKASIDYATLICNGADRPYAVWNKGFERMPILLPKKELTEEFNSQVKPLLEQIQKKYFIIQNLKQSRDRLLARLMNGKLDVEKLNIHSPLSMLEEENNA